MSPASEDSLSPVEFSGLLARTVGVPFALLAVIAGLLLWESDRLLDAAFRVDHADRVIAKVHHVERLFDDMESGARGYLLTRDASFRAPFDHAQAAVASAFGELENLLVRDVPADRQAVTQMREVLGQWQRSARDAMASPVVVPDLRELDRRRMLMAELRARGDSLRARQEGLRAHRAAHVSERWRLLPRGALVLLALAGLMLYFVGRRHLARLASSYDSRTRALRESKHHLATTLRSIADAVVTTDPSGRVAEMNPAAETLTGWTEAEARGRPRSEVVRLVDEETNRPLQAASERGVEDGVPDTSARRAALVARDGAVRPIAERSAPILSSSGTLLGVVTVVRDITEQRRRDEQLLAAQKMEAIGRLAGGVAHDFNNLLTVILGVCAVAMDRVSAEQPLHTDLEDIRRAGERAAALTRQLLAFGRKQVLAPRVLDVNGLIGDLERMLRRVIGEDVDLAVKLTTQPVWVEADPSQLEQVVLNLALNARDAMPGGGKLTIETSTVHLDEQYAHLHPGVAPKEYALVAVSDTGAGMSLDTQAHLFEPFFTTKDHGKGTGLGLATVHGIVRQSGGHIWVYSALGHGTVFKVYLPLGRSPDVAPEVFAPPTARRSAAHELVLVIEDEEGVRRFTARVLGDLGYRVLEASRGEEGVNVATAHPDIRLVITDVVMPGLSGRALERRLRQAIPDLRVIFISGYADEAIVHHGILDQGTHYLQKPFTPSVLAAKVRAVLDGME